MRRCFVDIEGRRVATIVVEGRASAVLLIHGNSSCKEIFFNQIDYLRKRGHTVVVPDLPGHGRSEDAASPSTTYSFPGYAFVVGRLMAQLDIREYHVVGWSLGGHIGLEMWYANPNVQSLLITGTPPVRLSAAGAALGFKETAVMNLAGALVFGPADVEAYGTAMLGSPPDRRLRVARTIARTDGKARHWMVRNGYAGIGTDEVMAVRRCRRPLAIVQGKNDPFVNIDYLHNLKYCNLWLNRPVIIEAGHAPHWQRPSLFNRYMRDFLNHVD
jgi:pimeloyl-ACP methyl ester carboxylesterase